MQESRSIIDFWFSEIDTSLWFKKEADFDRLIIDRFGELRKSAIQCELYPWRESPQGRLAEVIVLDQFSRNMYRDSVQAFASDSLALALAQQAVATGADLELSIVQRGFLYMPYMHSESAIIHQEAVQLFDQDGLEQNLRYELKHKEIIDEFGRYPHRNKVLGRASSAAEVTFLQKPGSSF